MRPQVQGREEAQVTRLPPRLEPAASHLLPASSLLSLSLSLLSFLFLFLPFFLFSQPLPFPPRTPELLVPTLCFHESGFFIF